MENKKIWVGVVVSDVRDKTRTVKLERLVPHTLYKKLIKKTSKVHIHDEENKSHIGDTVHFVSTRPYSKTKSWKLVKVIQTVK